MVKCSVHCKYYLSLPVSNGSHKLSTVEGIGVASDSGWTSSFPHGVSEQVCELRCIITAT